MTAEHVPYRTPDREAECEALRARVAELERMLSEATALPPSYVPYASPCPACGCKRADSISAFRRYVPPRPRTWWRKARTAYFDATCLQCRHEFAEGLPSRVPSP